MKDIIILNDRKINNGKKLLGFFLGGIILFVGIYTRSIYAFICGMLIIPSIMLNKYSIVNDDGIVIVYDVLSYKYKEYWNYIDISELHKEHSKKTENVSLHLLKGSMSKRLVLSRADSIKVINMAVKKNKKIHVSCID